jgi:hypothetical protein
LTACGAEASPAAPRDGAQGIAVQVSPSVRQLLPGDATTFTAAVTGTNDQRVSWSVVEAGGGSIDANGRYLAPSAPGGYHVRAASVAAPNVAGQASVTVVAPGTPAALYGAASSACASMPLRTTGTIYYFCDCAAGAQAGCVPGSDANAGTSPSAPRQTWGAAIGRFNAMNGGDTIALCGGGAWAVGAPAVTADCSNQLTNPRCAAGASLTDAANTSTCDIRDYASPVFPGTARPIIRASSASATRLLNRYTGSTNGVRVLNLDFRGGNAGPNGGVYYDHRAIASGLCNTQADSHWLICNNGFDRFRLGLQLSNSGTYSNFLIWGNRFTMNDLDALLLGNGDDNRIDANFFDNNGGFTPHPATGNAAHTVYLAGDGVYNSTSMSVVNNEIRRTGSGSAPGPSATGVLVGHEYYDGVNIENNIVDAGTGALGGCWAIDLRAAGSPPTHYRNMTIRRNLVNGGGAGIVVGQAPGVIIESNVVTLTGSGAWKQGIISPQDAARPGMDDVQNDTTIRNNTIYLTGTSVANNAILVGTEGTGHVIANNAVYSEGGACVSTTLPAGAYAFVGNNACSGGAAWGTTYDATPHVSSNPRFTAPPANLTPAAGSPLIGAGNPAYAPPWDFTMKVRPTPPSIGAYEP